MIIGENVGMRRNLSDPGGSGQTRSRLPCSGINRRPDPRKDAPGISGRFMNMVWITFDYGGCGSPQYDRVSQDDPRVAG